MPHTLWCGKPCAYCATEEHVDCIIDNEIPCSPDCENLDGDDIMVEKCISDRCDEIGYMLADKSLAKMSDDEIAVALIRYNKAIQSSF